MKIRPNELNVDFIGEQNQPPTKAELEAISAIIKKLKEERNKKLQVKSKKSLKPSKINGTTR